MITFQKGPSFRKRKDASLFSLTKRLCVTGDLSFLLRPCPQPVHAPIPLTQGSALRLYPPAKCGRLREVNFRAAGPMFCIAGPAELLLRAGKTVKAEPFMSPPFVRRRGVWSGAAANG